MQTRSMNMNLSPNGKQNKSQGDQQDRNKNVARKTMDDIVAAHQAKFNKQPEKHTPQLEKYYDGEMITSKELEQGYERVIAKVLELQKQLTQITEKIKNQDKRINNLSIDLRIQRIDTKDNLERIEKKKHEAWP